MVRGLEERDLICDRCISICALILREQGVLVDGIRALDEWSKALAWKKHEPDPEPPEGEGWELRGAVADEPANGEQRVLWFWQRDVRT